VPRAVFDPIFGLVLLVTGLGLAWKPLGNVLRAALGQAPTPREDGYFNLKLGAVTAAYISMFASLFGIGGGVIQVPFLVRALKFPPHVATATSQFVLMILSLVATLSHLAQGAFDQGVDQTMYLAVGVMMGAPVGALISSRVRGSMLVRMLALTLCFIGLRLLFGSFMDH
jgi:uncharacterized membrane protein YfcA